MSDSSQPHGLQPTRLLRPWDFPGKSTGVGCHCLLRGKLESYMQKKSNWRRELEDNKVEGCELTSSYENSTITTDEQASTKKTLEPI